MGLLSPYLYFLHSVLIVCVGFFLMCRVITQFDPAGILAGCLSINKIYSIRK